MKCLHPYSKLLQCQIIHLICTCFFLISVSVKSEAYAETRRQCYIKFLLQNTSDDTSKWLGQSFFMAPFKILFLHLKQQGVDFSAVWGVIAFNTSSTDKVVPWLSSVFVSDTEHEDCRTGSHWTDWPVSGQPGAAAGPHCHRRRQEPGKTFRASWQPQGNGPLAFSSSLCRCGSLRVQS